MAFRDDVKSALWLQGEFGIVDESGNLLRFDMEIQGGTRIEDPVLEYSSWVNPTTGVIISQR